ncbi:MAG: nuclease-related domain-containing protein [Pseudomonadota bacterium]
MEIPLKSKGQEGEIQVGLAIATLDRFVYHALHNVTVMLDDGTTQIDHVVISRYGIFVIETKNYSGWIFGSERQPEWTRSNFGRKDRFQNPLRQNYRHIKALSGFLGVAEDRFHSVVAFCGESEFKTPMPPNVLSSGYDAYIRGKQTVLLADQEVLPLVERLKEGMLPRGAETDRLHIDSLRQRHGNVDAGESARCAERRGKRRGGFANLVREAPVWREQQRLGNSPQRVASSSRTSRKGGHVALMAGVAAAVLLLFLLGGFVQGVNKMASAMAPQPRVIPKQPALPTKAPMPVSTDVVVTQKRPEMDPGLAVRLAEREAAEAKERAWERWYTPPKQCDHATEALMVECGNSHIRAKKEFDRLYAQGKIR